MRVLFISSIFPNAVQPDLGIFSLHIVREMALKAEVRVIAPVPSLGLFNFVDRFKKYRTDLPIPETETIEGVTVYHPSYFAAPGMGFLHHITMQGVLEPLIKEVHDEWHIDAVNCHWLFPDGVAVQRVCHKLGIPVMLTALGCDLNRYARLPARRRPIRQALVETGKVSVLNQQMAKKCLDLGVSPQKLCIIPNGVNLGQFSIKDPQTCRLALGLPADGKIVLFVGSLVEVKNVENLIRAFKLVTEGRKNAKLVLVGSGHLHDDLLLSARSLGIGEFVDFVGQVNHELLSDWMNAADCLCLPSIREGHPNVMMEALACGVPVVASLTGSIPDFINDANGLTIRHPQNYLEISEKILSCLSLDYDREQVRQSISAFSWDHCARTYLEELQTLAPVSHP